MYTKLVEITKEREKEDISIEVTVKLKGKVTKYGVDGHRLTGLLEDQTDKIDFISWKDMVNYVDANFQQGQTYIVKNIRIKRCSKMYTKTGKDVQLLFTNNTTVSRSEMGPLYCPVHLTKISDLKELADGEKVNVAGKIVAISDLVKQNNADKVTIRLADETGSVSASFWRDKAITFKGSTGDVFVAEGCTIRHYGDSYAVLNCPLADYSLNTENDSLLLLRHLQYDKDNGKNLSPEKTPAKTATINSLESAVGKQSLTATPVKMRLEIYYLCPLQGCGKSLLGSEPSFYCEKCNKRYIVSGDGLRLHVSVKDGQSVEDILMFNKTVENFLDLQRDSIKNMTQDELFTCVANGRYLFELLPKHQGGDYICSKVVKLSSLEVRDDQNDCYLHSSVAPSSAYDDAAAVQKNLKELPVASDASLQVPTYTSSLYDNAGLNLVQPTVSDVSHMPVDLTCRQYGSSHFSSYVDDIPMDMSASCMVVDEDSPLDMSMKQSYSSTKPLKKRLRFDSL